MQIDPALHAPADNYKLLTNLVVPRPIAWVSTCDSEGLVNLAPFSFFNAIGADPPYVMISIGQNDGGRSKDTARNIESGGTFVVNLVTEDLLPAMNVSAADFPSSESELAAAGLHAAASVHVHPPRVAEAQVSLECRLHGSQLVGNYTLVIGEVVMFHVADQLIDARLRIHDFAPIGRLGSPSVYCRTTERFDLPRISYGQWRKDQQ